MENSTNIPIGFFILLGFTIFQLVRLYLISKDEIVRCFCMVFLRKRYKEIYQQPINKLLEPGLNNIYFNDDSR